MERIITRPSTLDISSGKACPDCFYKAMNTNQRGVHYSREKCRQIAKDNAIDISQRCEEHRKERRQRRVQTRREKANQNSFKNEVVMKQAPMCPFCFQQMLNSNALPGVHYSLLQARSLAAENNIDLDDCCDEHQKGTAVVLSAEKALDIALKDGVPDTLICRYSGQDYAPALREFFALGPIKNVLEIPLPLTIPTPLMSNERAFTATLERLGLGGADVRDVLLWCVDVKMSRLGLTILELNDEWLIRHKARLKQFCEETSQTFPYLTDATSTKVAPTLRLLLEFRVVAVAEARARHARNSAKAAQQ